MLLVDHDASTCCVDVSRYIYYHGVTMDNLHQFDYYDFDITCLFPAARERWLQLRPRISRFARTPCTDLPAVYHGSSVVPIETAQQSQR